MTRYIQRFPDDWRQGTDLAAMRARAGLLSVIRQFFTQRNVLEVETPLLAGSFGTEPSIEPLQSEFVGPGFADGYSLYLQSSPEFAMKRLLSAGSGAIYQICKAFRNGEAGRRHNPEFTLLEWYRPGLSAIELMAEIVDLVRLLLATESLPVIVIRYADLFEDVLGLDVFTSDAEDLQIYARENNLLGADAMSLDKDGWLDLLMSSLIEPTLGLDALCFVTDYPASQASLARLNVTDPRTAARFELFYQGLELANGFEELSDADEQAERFEHENCARRSNGQQAMPVDQALLGALQSGLPACSGVALGIDRLLMCLLNVDDIDHVINFSLSRI